jgi:nitrite reductase/ring-hydroxylating ferredoxin subunit
MAFVRNQWYVAAYSAEVGRDLLARIILGEPLVLYRTSAGQPAALADRCVHRHFPLSASQLDGDTIVCGYHGFSYGPDGRFVAVPGQQRIPQTARVSAYPVAEHGGQVPGPGEDPSPGRDWPADLPGLLGQPEPGTLVYGCGPAPLLDALRAAGRGISRALGSPDAQRSTRHSLHRPAGHDHQDGAVVSRAAPS